MIFIPIKEDFAEKLKIKNWERRVHKFVSPNDFSCFY